MRQFLFMFIFCLFAFSCKKNDDKLSDTCSVEITQQLKNPYTLSNEVRLQGKKSTHQYVKFHLYNAEQYKQLQTQGVFLLDHPFDAVPDKNLQYKTEHTKQYGVYYGVVPDGVNINNIQSEKISDLYMPDEPVYGKTSGNDDKEFSGKITFFDPIDSIQVPLQGAKIIFKDATKTEYAISDAEGNFSVTTKALLSDTAEVLIQFDNNYLEIHTLDASDLFGVFGVNTYSLGFKKSCAFTNLNIEVGRAFNNAALHHSCAALHALNKYKEFAAHYGYLMPDEKMLFWLGKEAPISTSYAAPMLHNMADQDITNPTQLLVNLLGIPADLADLLALAVKNQLPDIYAPFYVRYATAARASFIETMFHELSHTSHYTKVGATFWLPYVEYIYGNGGYGTPDLPNSGIVGLSEAWAEDLSNIGLNYIYNKQKYLDLNEDPEDDWIPYGVYYDLYDTGSNEVFDNVAAITFPQIYSQFTADTRSIAAIKAKLKTNFPLQESGIENLFRHYDY